MGTRTYSVKTAAKRLGVSDSLMRYYVRKGKIKSKRIKYGPRRFKYVIMEDDLLEFIKNPKMEKVRIRGGKQGSMIGPYRITRVNGELIIERIGTTTFSL
jgi:excisionase family DNA binding protein